MSAPTSDTILIPIGHWLGVRWDRAEEPVVWIRVGPTLHELSRAQADAWSEFRLRAGDVGCLTAARDFTLGPTFDEDVQTLLKSGLLAPVAENPDSALTFAGSYRLLPLAPRLATEPGALGAVRFGMGIATEVRTSPAFGDLLTWARAYGSLREAMELAPPLRERWDARDHAEMALEMLRHGRRALVCDLACFDVALEASHA